MDSLLGLSGVSWGWGGIGGATCGDIAGPWKWNLGMASTLSHAPPGWRWKVWALNTWSAVRQYLWKPPRAKAGDTEFHSRGQDCIVWVTKCVPCGHCTPGVEILLLLQMPHPSFWGHPQRCLRGHVGFPGSFYLSFHFGHSLLVGPQVWAIRCMHGGLKGGVGAADSASGVSPVPGKDGNRGRSSHWVPAN